MHICVTELRIRMREPGCLPIASFFVSMLLSQMRLMWALNTNKTADEQFTPSYLIDHLDGNNTDLLDGTPPSSKLTYEEQRMHEEYFKCEETVLFAPYPTDGRLYCNRTFDGWGCWNDTPAGERAYINCPDFIPGFVQTFTAFKDCNPDGTWWVHPSTNRSWTNYTTCINVNDLHYRYMSITMNIAGYSVSLIAVVISLFIFCFFKSLQCTRITIHKNLFISFAMNNIMWIIWYTEVILRPNVIFNNNVPCQILHVLTQLFLVCNYFWMFCEGLYLHTLLVVAFVAEENLMKWFLLVGWGLPILLTTAYTLVRIFKLETESCWIENSDWTWLLSGPVCVSMIANLIFLCNIIWVLVTKLRAVNSPDHNQTRKAVRATLILIPLLGLHYIVMPFRPEVGSPWEKVYDMTSAFFTSFQGLFVALLFCFCNGEVIAVLRKKWNQHLLMRGRSRRPSYGTTITTMVDDHVLRRPSKDVSQNSLNISDSNLKKSNLSLQRSNSLKKSSTSLNKSSSQLPQNYLEVPVPVN